MTHSNLVQALEEELVCVGEFLELLATERDALSSGDLEQVACLAQNKLVLAQRLKMLGDHRQQLREQHTHSDPAGNDPLGAAPLDLPWNKLNAALDRAKEANRINGLIVSSRLAYVSNAINALHGAAGASPMYGRDGSARPLQTAFGMSRWSA